MDCVRNRMFSVQSGKRKFSKKTQRKEEKMKKSRGFTLIELLVVIAWFYCNFTLYLFLYKTVLQTESGFFILNDASPWFLYLVYKVNAGFASCNIVRLVGPVWHVVAGSCLEHNRHAYPNFKMKKPEGGPSGQKNCNDNYSLSLTAPEPPSRRRLGLIKDLLPPASDSLGALVTLWG